MNNSMNARKGYFKKGTGFSRYDSDGNVIYSESIGNAGEIVRHFYFYDDLQRRTHYSREEKDNVFSEFTKYYNDGSKEILSFNSNDCGGYCHKLYNNMGRMIKEIIEDSAGNIIHKDYDPYTGKYIIKKGKSPYICIL